MRKVVIPVAIAALAFGVWLITKDPEHGPVQVPSLTAPVVVEPEDRSTAAADNAPVISDQPAANDPVEPLVLPPDQVALTPMEQKAQSARALAVLGWPGSSRRSLPSALIHFGLLKWRGTFWVS